MALHSQLAMLALVLAGCVLVTNGQWRRKLATERFLYSGIDGSVEEGWSDAASVNLNRRYRLDEGGAEGVARLAFGGDGDSSWTLTAVEQASAYPATADDALVIRVKSATSAVTDFVLEAFGDFSTPMGRATIRVGPWWTKRRVPIRVPRGVAPRHIQSVALRPAEQNQADIYVGYLYLNVQRA